MRPDQIPEFRWRIGLSILVLGAGTVILVLTGAINAWWGMLLLAVAAMGVPIWLLRSAARLRRHITRAGMLVCVRCGYDLGVSPPEGRCPECGRPYTHRELRRSWRRLLEDSEYGPPDDGPEKHS